MGPITGFILSLVLLMIPSSPPVFAAPSITGISGSISDGQSVTLSGSGFGSNAAIGKIEWLGGAGGNIEKGTNGNNVSLPAGWRTDSTSSERQTPQYSTTRAHSGSKSIGSSWPQSTQYTSGFSYDTGGAIGTLYMTWWVYFEHVDGAGQWKMFRIMDSDSYADSDGTCYYNNWFNGDGSSSQSMHYMFCAYQNYDQCYPNSDANLRYTATATDVNKWIRIEVYGKESSSAGMRDGEFNFLKYPHTSGPVSYLTNGPWIGNIITRASGVSARWRWIEFENYWGNIQSGPGTNEKAYWDDIYIQTGTQARIELCAESAWASRKHCEIQIPSAWSSGSITFSLNQGSFSGSTAAYVYVVDSSGAVSPSGYPVTIGSGGGTPPPADTTPPASPAGLKVK
jgi:hypothetical protein